MTDHSALDRYLEEYKRDHQHPINQLTHMIGVPMIVTSLGLVFFYPAVAIGMFVVGWIFQFIGHAFEGKAPALLRNPKFLLGGPIWLAHRLASLVRRPTS